MKALRILMLATILCGALAFAAGSSAQARGTCWSGVRYGDSGTAHNYVEFHVTADANSWHIEKPWWAIFPAQLWTFPIWYQGNRYGIAKAGINGTDYDPPYSPSVYQLCTGP